jgi:hypothetical protein
MTPDIRIKNGTDAPRRVVRAAMWQSLSTLIKRWNSGWASGTA